MPSIGRYIPSVRDSRESKGGVSVASDLVAAGAVEGGDGKEELEEGDEDFDEVVAAT